MSMDEPIGRRTGFTLFFLCQSLKHVSEVTHVLALLDAEEILREQAAEITRLRAMIETHNADCLSQCEARRAGPGAVQGGLCRQMLRIRKSGCPDCPRDGLIDLAASDAQPPEAQTGPTDTERLDWIVRQDPDDFRICIPMDRDHDGEYEVSWRSVPLHGDRVVYGKTFREAIDAAMQADAQEGQP